MTTWQPMDSAPRHPLDNDWGDGGPYILVCVPWDEPYVGQGWWSDAGQCWRYMGDDGPQDTKPTHWMPLPEPPEVTP